MLIYIYIYICMYVCMYKVKVYKMTANFLSGILQGGSLADF